VSRLSAVRAVLELVIPSDGSSPSPTPPREGVKRADSPLTPPMVVTPLTPAVIPDVPISYLVVDYPGRFIHLGAGRHADPSLVYVTDPRTGHQGETALLTLIRAGWSVDQCQQLIGTAGSPITAAAPITADHPPITDHRSPITADHTDQLVPVITDQPDHTDQGWSIEVIDHARSLITDRPSISTKAIARSLVDQQLVGSISTGIRVARSVRKGTRP
jgi:hypothetical protein